MNDDIGLSPGRTSPPKAGNGTPGGVNGGSSGGANEDVADGGEAGDIVEYDDFLLFFDRAVSPLNAGI
jgi:hypothetical protein